MLLYRSSACFNRNDHLKVARIQPHVTLNQILPHTAAQKIELLFSTSLVRFEPATSMGPNPFSLEAGFPSHQPLNSTHRSAARAI